MEEVWKDITGYEGKYKVSNFGRIYVCGKERVRAGIKKSFINKNNGYEYVCLTKNGKQETKLLHRIVAQEFLKPDKNKQFINHIDKDKTNNNVSNLEYCTRIYNNRYSMGKKVAMFDINGKYIKTFDTITDASKETGCTHISEVCRGKRAVNKGYKFKYVN